MKKLLLVVFPVVAAVLLVSIFSYSETVTEQDSGQSDDTPRISYEFEAGDIIATRDDDSWNVGKIMKEGGQGKDREIQVLFANGEEAWVKPSNVKKSIALIKRNELRVGTGVFFTTQDPGDFHNHSIRFTTFYRGKITSIGKLHRDVITVNSTELNWKTQVIMAK